MAYSRIKCPKCVQTFAQEKRFSKHLRDDHNVQSEHEEALLYSEVNTDGSWPTCACRCGKPVAWHGWKEGFASRFVRGHNAVLDSIYNDPEKQAAMAAKRAEGYRTGRLRTWNDGLSKDVDERLLQAANNLSRTHHQKQRLAFKVKTNPNDAQVTLEEACDKRVQKPQFGEAKPLLGDLEKESSDAFEAMKGEVFAFVHGLNSGAVLMDHGVTVLCAGLNIECDELYRSSEAFAGNKVDRTDFTDKKLSIFSDEWRDKRPIIESMIRHRLKLTPRKVNARECTVRQLKQAERAPFFNANHIDGDVRSHAAWGLFTKDDELVSAISVRRAFHKGHADWLEVGRFCSLLNTSVRGALSRLSCVALKHASSQGKRGLMTYVDRRIGDASGYINAGFKHTRDTSPRFWWTDFKHRYDRFSVRADSVNGITQAQRAKEAGVVKVWGCGNVVLQLEAAK